MAGQQVATLGKRKRTQVSYAVDDMFDKLGLPIDDDVENIHSDEEIDEPVKVNYRLYSAAHFLQI